MSFVSLGIKALKGTQSTNPDQWSGVMLSSSTTGCLMARALLPLQWLSDVSISASRMKEIQIQIQIY